MDDSPEELEPVEDDGEIRKGFREHLEDLRWVLVRCAIAVAVAMTVCLVFGDRLVAVLEWPLQRLELFQPKGEPTVSLLMGNGTVGTFTLRDGETFAGRTLAKGEHVAVRLDTVAIDGHAVLTAQVDPAVPASVVAGKQVLLRNFSPVEAFFVVFHVAIYAGLAVASPFLLYFLGGFVLPALRPKEKRYVYYGLGFSVGLFVLGVIFCYFLLLPVSLEASRMYSHWLGFAANEWQASEYIGFVTKFMFGMGLGFQLPVVLLTLVRIGLINYRQLIAWRRYVIVLNLILGAVLTTPEVVTQLLLAIPLQLLYEISILVAWLWARKLRRQAAATEET